MRPDLFPLFCIERLTWFGEWIDGTKDIPGRGTMVGAITFAALGITALFAFLNRRRLSPVWSWTKNHPRLSWLAGIVVGLPVTTIILMCLTKYLTFASALATTVGVLVALASNNRTHDREEQRFNRQAKAARAALALELSSLVDYCEGCVKALRKPAIRANPVMAKTLFKGVSFPAPPTTAAATFKEMINSTRYEEIADRCAVILGHLQLVKANLKDLEDGTQLMGADDVNRKVVDVVILYTAVVSLFDFARKNSMTLMNVNWEAVKQHSVNLEASGHPISPDYYRYVKRAERNYPDPLHLYDIK